MTLPVSRPVAFPLHLIVDGACGCGFASCTRIGKHPVPLWRELAYGDPVDRPAPGAGVGLKTGAHPRGSDIVVVDLDGEDAVAAWEALGGSPDTYTIETGRRVGLQLYFQPEPGLLVRNSRGDLWHNGKTGDDAQGIDVRGEGGYVVAEGSPHRSGKTYKVFSGAPVARMPAWLVAWFKARPAPAADLGHYAGDVDGEERDRRIQIYCEYLRTAPPCVQGQGGDETLFRVVQRGAYDLALPADDVLQCIEDVYDVRCTPPWGDELEERVAHKVRTAKQQSTRLAMPPLPADLAHLGAPSASVESAIKDIVESQQTLTSTERKQTLTSTADGPVVWGGWNEPILPPIYLVEGLIPEDKVCTFFAEGGSLKSWAAFSLAISIASGKPWLDTFPVQKGRAVLIDYEDGPYEYKRRIRLLEGQDFKDIPDLGYYNKPPPLDEPDLWKNLLPLGLKLIVIDALSSGVSADVDENDRQFSNAVKIAGKFTDVGCTVVFVHHANKQGGMRGSSTVRDQSDIVFKFDAVSETDSTKRMRMVCDKPGPQKRPKPVNVELSDEGLKTFVDEAQTKGRNARTIEDVKQAVLLTLASGAKTGVELRAAVGGDNKRVDEALKQLEERAEVFSRGSHRGWELDDREKMLGRLRVEAETATGSKADFARRAFVQPDVLQEFLDEGLVVERVKGKAMGFIVL